MAAHRSVLFIDGSNWYHALCEINVGNRFNLNYAKISSKLIGPARTWIETRYYIGRVQQTASGSRLYADQRRFLEQLRQTDERISIHLGRLEPRPADNRAAEELHRYLNNLERKIDRTVYHDLLALAQRHRTTEVIVEKAVDVQIAVDMVMMAQRDAYDAAYLLSADGDFTPAVAAVRSFGKKIYAASPLSGARLAAVVNSFIPLTRIWFNDCYFD